MTQSLRKIGRRLLTILPVILAVLVVAYMVMHRTGPKPEEAVELVRTLRVIETPSVNLVPRVTGYGVAKPGWVWEAVAEVKGTIISVHPSLKSGAVIQSDTVLMTIDPTEYKLVIDRLVASVEQTRANINELAEEEKNTEKLLTIEERSLILSRKSLERKNELLKRKSISQDDVDREERNVLQQQQSVQRLENTLALIPSRRKALQSGLAVQQSSLDQAKIELAKTVISAPYDCRLGEVSIEAGQYVRAGQSLFKAHGTAVTEIETRFRIDELRHLLGEHMRGRFQPGLSMGSFKQLFAEVGVIISLQSGDWSAQWEGRIDRLREGVDYKTREVKVVVAVDHPYEQAIPGVRPPLTEGMFCRVELLAKARPESVIVPRTAMHGDRVFFIGPEHQLQTKEVAVDFAQSDFVVIQSGLSEGEMVVVSDPTPAIIGMKVSPVFDDKLRQQLIDSIQGQRAKQ